MLSVYFVDILVTVATTYIIVLMFDIGAIWTAGKQQILGRVLQSTVGVKK